MADVLFFVNGAGPYGRFAALSNGFPSGGSGVGVTLAAAASCPDCSRASAVYVETDGSMCLVLWILSHVQACLRGLMHHSPD